MPLRLIDLSDFTLSNYQATSSLRDKCAAKFMASSLRLTKAMPGACDANDEESDMLRLAVVNCIWILDAKNIREKSVL